MNIDLLTERGLISAPLNVVINCRPDRIERNGQMGELTGRLSPERIVLIGEQTRSAKVAVPAELADRVVDLGGPLDFTALLDALVTDTNGDATLIAIGNIHGQGEVLLDRLHELPTAAGPHHPAPGPADRPRHHRAQTRPAPLRMAPPRPRAELSSRSDLLTDTSTDPAMPADAAPIATRHRAPTPTPTASDAVRRPSPRMSRPSPWRSACCSPWPAT